ncbi:glycosyltransferase involved in cell wall biosynthesis (plasmid) [Ensifer sp. WSM1721]|uniref:glycosyltransferase family 2 protein n=1 Tax=Ensifer sp. WSM1721 TaxID=1041159 RepID=UPI00047D01C0|nr:glycosyltransferase family 2 protein [Ensifer sp. WSM1721]
MRKSKLVVAFPVYNGARTLEQSLQCIADQDFKDFRAIIVENKSTDNTLEVARAFCRKDPRFEIVENSRHLNALDNFANAITLASERGEYFCLRACDDLSSPDYLSKLLAALEAQPSKLLAAGATERIDGDRVRLMIPNSNIFDFAKKIAIGQLPRNLTFPAEWLYGVFRSDGATEILLRRWPELGRAWCAASYTIAEFVIRDLATYVEGPAYHFFVGSGSEKIYGAKTLRDKLQQRWIYTMGCYRLRHKLPPMSWYARWRFWLMCWNDARRKTGYYILGRL